MPELPEVETIARSLRPKLTGLTFAGARVLLPKIVAAPTDSAVFEALLAGKRITEVSRRGKYLLLTLSGDYVLAFHLRMTGSLILCRADEPAKKHTHIVMELENGRHLRYADPRQFGRVWLLPAKEMARLAGFKDLGPEPFDPVFTEAYLVNALKRRHTRIKPLLLDQTFVAGLGNIYTDEALYRAGIEPETKASAISARAAKKLRESILSVLQEGIDNRGSSIRDYIDGEGEPGNFQNLLRVYGKEGAQCQKCGTIIKRKKVGARGTFFCPKCQR